MDIDAAVGAFVEDLVELVRRAALDAAREAFAAQAGPVLPARPAAVPKRRAEARAARADEHEAPEAESKPMPAPPAPRKLDRQRPGRLVFIPSSQSESPSPAEDVPAPRYEVIPPRKPRKQRTVRAAAAPEATPAAPAEPIPARQWVVVRRPAKDWPQTEASATPNGAAPINGNTPSTPPPAAEPAELPSTPPPEPAAAEPERFVEPVLEGETAESA
ncbi:MAG: hypothetical protein QM820_34580 [Minicystis sp.]